MADLIYTSGVYISDSEASAGVVAKEEAVRVVLSGPGGQVGTYFRVEKAVRVSSDLKKIVNVISHSPSVNRSN